MSRHHQGYSSRLMPVDTVCVMQGVGTPNKRCKTSYGGGPPKMTAKTKTAQGDPRQTKYVHKQPGDPPTVENVDMVQGRLALLGKTHASTSDFVPKRAGACVVACGGRPIVVQKEGGMGSLAFPALWMGLHCGVPWAQPPGTSIKTQMRLALN